MNLLAIDYAWTHPDPQAIYAAGYRIVMRYLSHDDSKDLSVAEAKALHAAGLGIGLVWETTASRAGAGEAAGKADATYANTKADALGFPKSCPIFYAVDYDATPNAVTPYFIGAGNVTGRPLGVYGSYRVVEAMMAAYCNYGWQTMAWSWDSANQRYFVSPHAHLYQRIKHTLGPIAGVADAAWDEDAVLRTFPLWNPPTTQEDTLSAAEVQEIKDYIRALLVDNYTVLGVDHPGIAKVVEENQKRITTTGAALSSLSTRVNDLGDQQSKVATAVADLRALLEAAGGDVTGAVAAAAHEALANLEVTLAAKAANP